MMPSALWISAWLCASDTRTWGDSKTVFLRLNALLAGLAMHDHAPNYDCPSRDTNDSGTLIVCVLCFDEVH